MNAEIWKKDQFAKAVLRAGRKTTGLAYTVQYIWDVDKSVNNVRRSMRKGSIHFEVSMNCHNAHKLSFADLCAMADATESRDLLTALNRATSVNSPVNSINNVDNPDEPVKS